MQQFKSVNDPKLAKLINDGAVGVLPTDTIYGLVASAGNKSAVSKLYALKARAHKPGTGIASSTDQLVELGIPKRYLSAVEQYWPGPVSVEIPHDISYLNQDTGRQAFRVVSDEAIKGLLEKTGPLVTSSANDPGQPPAVNLKQAKDYFGDKVDFYVEGGDLSGRPPSTIIRVIDDAVEVVRQGAVKIDEDSGEIIS
ncbi:L-threonylcarbamoyladenylate synthase [Candidatus Saccharibacteria bacterium]|nr:L-threonylcarbamoyladenylate synthase [Candidatus Saccharibacteria bacterium]